MREYSKKHSPKKSYQSIIEGKRLESVMKGVQTDICRIAGLKKKKTNFPDNSSCLSSQMKQNVVILKGPPFFSLAMKL